ITVLPLDVGALTSTPRWVSSFSMASIWNGSSGHGRVAWNSPRKLRILVSMWLMLARLSLGLQARRDTKAVQPAQSDGFGLSRKALSTTFPSPEPPIGEKRLAGDPATGFGTQERQQGRSMGGAAKASGWHVVHQPPPHRGGHPTGVVGPG